MAIRSNRAALTHLWDQHDDYPESRFSDCVRTINYLMGIPTDRKKPRNRSKNSIFLT